MSDTIRFSGTTVNAPMRSRSRSSMPRSRAGWPRARRWAAVSTGALIAFQQVEDFRPPTWPGGSAPMQLHLDFFVDDLAASGARATAAGARLSRSSPSDHCRVYADPAGHPFCLSTWGSPRSRRLTDLKSVDLTAPTPHSRRGIGMDAVGVANCAARATREVERPRRRTRRLRVRHHDEVAVRSRERRRPVPRAVQPPPRRLRWREGRSAGGSWLSCPQGLAGTTGWGLPTLLAPPTPDPRCCPRRRSSPGLRPRRRQAAGGLAQSKVTDLT